MKKIVVALVLAAMVGTGAFAEVALGVSGALHMDQNMTASEIQDEFSRGENIFYGGFLELMGKHVGLGVAGNFSFWNSVLDTEFVSYDVSGYLSYHLFKSTALLDPFGELGVGVLAYDYANEAEDTNADAPLAGSLYWDAAIGVGINLGPIGIFGKFSYNFIINKALTYTDDYGNQQNLLAYAYDSQGDATVPPYRFTIGAKLIL